MTIEEIEEKYGIDKVFMKLPYWDVDGAYFTMFKGELRYIFIKKETINIGPLMYVCNDSDLEIADEVNHMILSVAHNEMLRLNTFYIDKYNMKDLIFNHSEDAKKLWYKHDLESLFINECV
jgi:hypothetical protein